MASVRQQIYEAAAAYTPFTALAYAGSGSLFGSDDSPDPPPALLACPWFYLERLSQTASFSGDPNYLESGFRWWGYDLPQAGYVRLRHALGVLARAPAYLESASDTAPLYLDSDTGELVFWQRPTGFGQETGDQERGLLVLTYTWQTRESVAGEWP